MLQLTLNNTEYLFVPVVKITAAIIDDGTLCIKVDNQGSSFTTYFPLTSGQWSIVGTTAEVLQSEELAKEIVEKECDGYSPISGTYPSGCYDYVKKEFYSRFPAKSSFRTLLQHHNIPHSIILQKQ